MEEEIRILQLSPRFTFPPDDGGKIGIANITKQFALQGAKVTFVAYSEETIPQTAQDMIAPYAELQLIKHSTANSPWRLAKSIFRNESLYISKHRSKSAFLFLSELLKENKLDIIHADHSCMVPLALALKQKFGIPLGLRLHNIEWTIWQRYADILPIFNPKKYYVQSQAKKLKSDESMLLNTVDVAFAITDIDRQRALELCPSLNVIVASAGIEPEEWIEQNPGKRNARELIIATTYHWRHNVDALDWFIRSVFFPLRKNYPDLQLTLIGKEPPELFNKYRNKGVDVVGYVPKVQPYLHRAGIYISPLFVGGGIRIKILEAMASSLPVVASPVAAEGINAGPEHGLFSCETAEDFQIAISGLIDNNKTEYFGEKAREYVSEHFSWSKNVGLILNEYKRLITI